MQLLAGTACVKCAFIYEYRGRASAAVLESKYPSFRRHVYQKWIRAAVSWTAPDSPCSWSPSLAFQRIGRWGRNRSPESALSKSSPYAKPRGPTRWSNPTPSSQCSGGCRGKRRAARRRIGSRTMWEGNYQEDAAPGPDHPGPQHRGIARIELFLACSEGSWLAVHIYYY